MSFTRGTTPVYRIIFEDVSMADIKDVYVTFEQAKNNVEITKHGEELTRSDTGVSLTLSQSETLKFQKGTIKIQIRAIDYNDMATATSITEDTVNDVLYEKVIQ